MTTADDLRDVVSFLADTLPFSDLSEGERLDVARCLTIEYVPRHQNKALDLGHQLYLIRTGAFELKTSAGELLDRLGEHDLFGINTLVNGNPQGLKVYPIEDALVFKLPHEDFERLCERYSSMRQFFHQISTQRDRLGRLHMYDERSHRLEQQLMQRVSEFVSQAPVSCAFDATIREAAMVMREQRVSSLLLLEGTELRGIVTDRDLRNRVVADGLDVNRPVIEVATHEPVSIGPEALLFDAQKLMSQFQVHHLPVMDHGKATGIISATDLIRAQQVSPLYLVNDILRQTDLDALAELRHKVPALIHNWVQADIHPYEMGRVLAAIGDAFVQRCLRLAQNELGEAPFAFAWLAFGSQARMDQTFASDQDNALILGREPMRDEAEYFGRLADWVCRALDRCGYTLCPGDIMASNPKWRRTTQGWIELFDDWMDSPTPEALLNGSIFFDVRVIDGDERLLMPIQDRLVQRAPESDIFLAMMTQTAVRNRPPLGFFRQFVVQSGGEHEDELNLKHRGVALVNDLARIHALAAGSHTVSTRERLEAAMAAGLLDRDLGQSLQEVWSLIAGLRIEEQSLAVRRGETPTSFLDPDGLSPLTRAHLKDAFGTLKRAQQTALQQFARGLHG